MWKGLKSIGVVISECVRDGKATDEVRYYISSLGGGREAIRACGPEPLGHRE